MLKTAECVSPKHPDKLCDQISDAILDACLTQDPNSRAAIETMGGHGVVTVTGELTTTAYVDVQSIVHRVLGDDRIGVMVNIVKQSPEISQGVDTGGAGDQGIMVGYACNENESMIPHELFLARSLCKFIYNTYPYDGKTQITLNDRNKIQTIVTSFQKVSQDDLRGKVLEWLKIIEVPLDEKCNESIYCNPAGDWNLGGFDADTGLTGRKIAVDSYGPRVPVGGGAFSGKDSTKVDRSGAYMARYLAVEALREHGAKEVYCYLAYSIGVAEPVQVTLVVDGIEKSLPKSFLTGLTPKDIIRKLYLTTPKFEKTARWGHFGNGFIWDSPLSE